MRKRPLLIVEWDDTSGGSSWDEEEGDYTGKLVKTYTVGWKLKSNRKTLVLASTRNEHSNCTDRTIVSRKCVTKITKLL